MALNKQNISISFASGLDTKTDPNQVIPGKMVALQNTVFTEAMAFKKKNGFQVLGSIPNGESITTFQDELVSFDGLNLYSHSPTSMSEINKGVVKPVNLSAKSIFRAPTQQTQQDSAFNSVGLYLYTWVDGTNGAQYMVVSSETGQRVVTATNLPANSIRPRAWAMGNYLVVTFVNSSNNHLQYISIPVINPTNPGSAVDLATNVSAAHPNYDGAITNNSLYLAWNASDGGGAIRVTYLDSNLNQHNTIVVGAQDADTCLSVFVDNSFSNPEIWVAYGSASVSILYFVRSSNGLASILGATTAAAGVTGLQNVNGYSTGGNAKIYYQVSNTYSYNSVRSDAISYVAVTDTGTVGSPVAFQKGVGIISKWFKYNSVQYCVFDYSGALQPTYFILDSSANIITRLAYSNGGGYTTNDLLTNVNAVGSTSFQFSYLFKDLLETVQGTVYTQTGVNSANINFDMAQNFQEVELGKNLNITGGIMYAYDGYSPVEQNFHLYPEDLGITSSTSGSPAIAAGTYNYIAIYQWTDNQGNIHRSAYAPQTAITFGSTSTVTVNVPNLRLTAKTNVSIVLFRDAPSVSTGIFYRVSSITSPTISNKTINSVAIVDNSTDASIVGNELLYTTGGVVENVGGPPSVAMNVYKNRLMALDAEDRNKLWYSKQVIEGVPVEFSDLFTLYIDPRYGECTALAILDDKEIFFKFNSIFYMTGQGPDNTGANNDFSDAVFITSNVGTDNPNSIVTVPDGLMFQSNKGIWLLDRGLGCTYIGAQVEAYNSYTVTSAQLIPNSTQVRFTLNTNLTLVYDYFYKQWDVFTTVNPASSTLFENLHTYLTVGGVILQEQPGMYLENNVPILMSMTTGWLSFANLQGYQRAYQLYFLGQYLSPHVLAVSVAYDFNPSIVQTTYITPDQINNAAYGDDPYYGSEDTYGGISNVEQWRINLERQKCQSIQITIQELVFDDNPTPGPGLVLEAIGILVGVKSTYPRLPAGRITA